MRFWMVMLLAVFSSVVQAEKFHCDGRNRCNQMTSCEEATWFINHCPGMKMDGDHDGVPCEDQWCGSEEPTPAPVIPEALRSGE